MEETKNKILNRREFINAFMGASILVSLGLFFSYFLRFLFSPNRHKSYRKLYVTQKKNIPSGKSLKVKDLRGQSINIINTGEEFIALSTKCSHLGCNVFWKDLEKKFFCPCHDGYFDSKGNVLSGPPPKPLSSYKVEVVNESIFIHVDEVNIGNA
jgi:cytochrome b6-f complex iron-sulfur subunit